MTHHGKPIPNLIFIKCDLRIHQNHTDYQRYPKGTLKGLARWDVKTTNLGPCWFSRWQRASAGGNKHQIDRKDWKQMGKQKQQAEPTSLKSFDIYSEILFIMLVHKYIYII